MRKLWTTVAALAVFSLAAAPDLQAQGRGKGQGNGKGKPPVKRGGDNRDDARSGKVDRPGDGNSGQGDDLHRKRHKGSPQNGDQPRKRGKRSDGDGARRRDKKDGSD